MVHFKPQVDWQ